MSISTYTVVVLNNVKAERDRQDVKWGADRVHSPTEWLAILAEEFGEIGRAILKGDENNYYDEVIQLAAVAVAMAESVELTPPEFPFTPKK